MTRAFTTAEREQARTMAAELRAAELEVVLVPSQVAACAARGGKIRQAIAENPRWYRDLCAGYASQRGDLGRWRKHKTSIKRLETLDALDRIASGLGGGCYLERLRPHIRAEIARAEQQLAYERAAYEARTNPPRARSYVTERRR